MIKRLVFLFTLLINSYIVFSQEKSMGNWLVYFGNQKLSSKWNIQSDFQYRIKQIEEQKGQTIIRAGLGYNLSNNNHNVLLGLAYVNTQFDEEIVAKTAVEEKRVYQQYLYKQQIHDYFITHRVRLEERFFASEFGLRSRYFISLQKSLNGKSLNKKSIYASFINETFIDLKKSNFDRNRLYAGLGYAINDFVRVETGYMIQAQKNSTRGQIQFSVYNNLSL
jgi:hypothetical protein